jgi:arginase family enzyme
MSLTLFLNPIDASQLAVTDPYALLNYSSLYEEILPDIHSHDFIIVGVGDGRGGLNTSDASDQLLKIRKAFYNLQAGAHQYKIADLGNINPGPAIQDTYERLTLIVKTVLNAGKTLIILGNTHDLTIGQYMAYAENKQTILATVDAHLDLNSNNEAGNNTFFMAKILAKLNEHLLKWIPIGYQAHTNQYNHLKILDSLLCPSLRLGSIKQNIAVTEPYIRNANMLSIDMGVLAWPYSSLHQHPFGLQPEELIQLIWYAGYSEKCTSLGFYELYGQENKLMSAQLVATMMWYFIDARYCAGLTGGPYFQNFTKLTITHEAFPHPLVFVRNSTGEKYWIEHQLNDELVYIACSENDYLNAKEGIEPEMLIYFYA